MRNLISILAIAALFISIACPVFARAVQAQVPTPEVGGPTPGIGGRTTVTPGGVRDTPSPVVPPAPAPIAEPAEPAITPEPEQPEVVAPPTVLEPAPPADTRTVPRIEMESPAAPSIPAGTGAGPGITAAPEAVPMQDQFDFSEGGTFAAEGPDDIIPRAGLGYGWISLLGGALTAAGVALKKRVERVE